MTLGPQLCVPPFRTVCPCRLRRIQTLCRVFPCSVDVCAERNAGISAQFPRVTSHGDVPGLIMESKIGARRAEERVRRDDGRSATRSPEYRTALSHTRRIRLPLL